MAKTKQKIDIDRELELTINVMESGAVEFLLSSGTLETELGPGDTLVLVLRPTNAQEPPPEVNDDTWNSKGGGGGRIERTGGVHSRRETERPKKIIRWRKNV